MGVTHRTAWAAMDGLSLAAAHCNGAPVYHYRAALRPAVIRWCGDPLQAGTA